MELCLNRIEIGKYVSVIELEVIHNQGLRPQTLVMNNLEFDHADIFADLNAIQTQFHHLVRCIPSSGHIIASKGDAIDEVLNRGCWTPVS